MQDTSRLVSSPGLNYSLPQDAVPSCGVDVAQFILLAKLLGQIYSLLNNQFGTWVSTQ